MKTSNWTNFAKALYLIAIAAVMVSTTGCPDKDKTKSSVSRFHRNDGYGGQNYDPQTGQYSTEWGAIYNFRDSDLRAFMSGVSDLGYVNSSMSADTGIRFRTNKSTESIEILVWDDVANQTNQAYFWSLRVESIQGGVVVASDNAGRVIFRGSFVGNEWKGTIDFENNPDIGGQRGQLGSFAISADQMF